MMRILRFIWWLIRPPKLPKCPYCGKELGALDDDHEEYYCPKRPTWQRIQQGSNRGVHCFRLTPDLKITKLVPEEKLVDLLERCYLSLKSNVHGDTEDALIAELKVLLK